MHRKGYGGFLSTCKYMNQGSLNAENPVLRTTNDPAGSRKQLTSVKREALVGGVIYVPGHRPQMGMVVVRFVPGASMQIAGFLGRHHQLPIATESPFF